MAAMGGVLGETIPTTKAATIPGEMNPQNIWMYWNTLPARPTIGAHRHPTRKSTSVAQRPTRSSCAGSAAGRQWRW